MSGPAAGALQEISRIKTSLMTRRFRGMFAILARAKSSQIDYASRIAGIAIELIELPCSGRRDRAARREDEGPLESRHRELGTGQS
jgi:hypothetical protein